MGNRFLVVLGLAALLVSPAVAEAGVKVLREDSPYGITGRSAAAIAKQVDRAGGAKLTATIVPDIQVATRKPSTCYVTRANYVLHLRTIYPRLDGEVSAKLRRRWDAYLAAVVLSDAKTRQGAMQTAQAMFAATVNLSMENDPRCKQLGSILSRRLRALDQKFKAAISQYVNQQNGPSGPVGKAAATFYREP